MWTWSFELADVLTTLTIISTLGGMAYYLVIRPFLQRLEEDRINDRTFFSSKYDTLIEIKLSRQDRIQQAQRHIQLVGRVELLESRVDDLRNEIHGDKR